MAIDQKISELTEITSISTGIAANYFFPVTLYGVDYKIAANIINPYIGEILSVNGVFSEIQLFAEGSPRQARIFSSTGDISYQINGTGYTVANNSTVTIDDETKNYTLILTTSGTFEAVSDDDLFFNDSFDYIPVGFVTKNQSTILTFGQQDLASAQKLQINPNNWTFYITENSTDIELITRLNFQEGRIISLIVLAGQTIKHDQTIDGDDIPILLSKGSDFTASKKTGLILIAHDTDGDDIPDVWIEASPSSLADQLNSQLNTEAEKIEAAAYSFVASGKIIAKEKDYFAGKFMSNMGTATLTVYDDYIEFSAGTLYGIKSSDGEIEIPCNESQPSEIFIHDIQQGKVLLLDGTPTVVTQDEYFPMQINGVQFVTLDSTNEIEISYKNNKQPIYT